MVSRMTAKIGAAILALALLDLVYINYWVVKQDSVNRESRQVETITASPQPSASPLSSPDSSPIAKNSADTKTIETKTVVEKEIQTIVQTAQKEIFVPIGSGSTKSSSYVDLSGLEVSVDTTKYSGIDSVVFEGSIWVQDGNGKVNAQLYNKTDSHPVWNSQISTSSANGVLTTSSKINLDSGNKIYRVQAKTDLVEYAAHVDGARIKITLK